MLERSRQSLARSKFLSIENRSLFVILAPLPLNTITYTGDFDSQNSKSSFGSEEGILLPSNKQEFLRKLKSFEGLHIAGCKIDYSKFESQSKWRYLGRVLEFEIGITRQFVYQHCPSQTTTKSRYKFIFISETWELYKGKELVYADKDYKQYEDPAPHAKLFKDTQLVSVDINKDWSEATFVFGNEFTLIARRCYKNVIGSAFFTLIQETEPYRKLMHFDAPDFIAYSNESTQYIVTPRKNRAKVLEGMPHQSKGSVSSLLSMKT